MQKKFEQYKKLYIMSVNLLMMAFAAFIFWNIWFRRINILQYIDFKNKGNWLIVIVYIILLIAFFRGFGAFRIGYYTISNLLISQFLACVCVHIILCIQVILIIGRVRAIHTILLSILEVFFFNWISIGLITVLFTKLYNKLLPPPTDFFWFMVTILIH